VLAAPPVHRGDPETDHLIVPQLARLAGAGWSWFLIPPIRWLEAGRRLAGCRDPGVEWHNGLASWVGLFSALRLVVGLAGVADVGCRVGGQARFVKAVFRCGGCGGRWWFTGLWAMDTRSRFVFFGLVTLAGLFRTPLPGGRSSRLPVLGRVQAGPLHRTG